MFMDTLRPTVKYCGTDARDKPHFGDRLWNLDQVYHINQVKYSDF